MLVGTGATQADAIEAKGMTALGWSAAILAVMSSGDIATAASGSWMITIAAVVGSVGALARTRLFVDGGKNEGLADAEPARLASGRFF